MESLLIAMVGIMNTNNIFCMPKDYTFDELIELLEEDVSIYKYELIPYMKVIAHQLDQLNGALLEEKGTIFKTIQLLVEQAFKGECSRLMGFQMFDSPLALGEHLVHCYEDDDLLEVEDLELMEAYK